MRFAVSYYPTLPHLIKEFSPVYHVIKEHVREHSNPDQVETVSEQMSSEQQDPDQSNAEQVLMTRRIDKY